jgi:cephalosporin hydroxylase
MNVDLDHIFATYGIDQCRQGAEWLYKYVEEEIKPKVYVEIGCAQLGTFFMHEHLLPSDGLAIGVDVKDSKAWKTHTPPNKSTYYLLKGDSASPDIVGKVKELLGGRSIDFLFIDGDHDIEPVQKDWDNSSSLVRPGGLIAFHDFDYSAYARGEKRGQGAAWVCMDLVKQGHTFRSVPVGSIGVVFTRK